MGALQQMLMAAGGAAGAFSPSSLYSGGHGGGYFDFTDAANLWADNARTTPATPGGVILGVTDLSGNGYHMGNAASLGNITRQTGYVQHNAGGLVISNGTKQIGSAAGWSVVFAARATVGGSLMSADYGSTNNIMRTQVNTPASASGLLQWNSVGALQPTNVAPSALITSTSVDFVASFHVSTSEMLNILQTSGAYSECFAKTSFTPNSSASGYLGVGFAWFGSGSPTYNPFTGRAYAAVFINRVLTRQELQDAAAWCAAKAGFTPTNASYLSGPAASVLLVGGGGGGAGGGANTAGGGGGAGRMINLDPFNLSSGSETITFTIGGAGAAGTSLNNDAGNGGNTTMVSTALGTYTANGGGGGRNGATGISGGSGGGRGGTGSGGAATQATPATNVGLGGNGSQGSGTYGVTTCQGGGGGGAGGDGAVVTQGPGSLSSITGSSLTYAQGGNGGVVAGSGPNGSGPSANTGSGGHGSNGASGNGSAGATGVAILRLLTSAYTGNVTGSPTVTTDGAYTVVKFTSTGTYTT